jgi:ribonucleoside-triphosphate reductase
MRVIKRNRSEVDFDPKKITAAISAANNEVAEKDRMAEQKIISVTMLVCSKCEQFERPVTVEEIQEIVETELMKAEAYEVAKCYIRYRYDHNLKRKRNTTDDVILSLIERKNEEVKHENSNKNPTIVAVQRDYMAGEVSKDLTRRFFLPDDIVEAHDNGIIHFHDADYFAQNMHNCDLVNLDDMLQNGTVISGTMIEKPHSFSTACNIATQIIAQVSSCQYGGQSISLAHLAPFVQVSRDKIARKHRNLLKYMSVEEYDKFVEDLVREDIVRGVQTIQYQIVTLMTTNGQTPFITVYMDINEVPDGQMRDDLAVIIEEVLAQRIQGIKNEVGVWITPTFPKLIYTLDENNIRPGAKYYYLTELAAKCTAKRMVPDYISAKLMRELKSGDVYTCMGCRSFLTPDRFTATGVGNIANAGNYHEGERKYYGRFNQGVVTINLVDVALSSGGDIEKFWKILDERLNLCYRALMIRHTRLEGTISDVAPILWQHGALARLKSGETIDRLLHGGYSTISLGYAGLYECTKYMTGVSHTDGTGKAFALEVMEKLNAATCEWKAKENVDFSLYGTPLESTTYKFAKCLQRRFGVIEGVTDKNYITNSYHVHVSEPIDAFTKLKFEAEFQALSPGGAISYIEVPNMTHNIEAVLSVIGFIYDNIMYAELNTKSDFCQVCSFDGEIQIIEEDGKLVWECPNCGNRDQSKLNVARRTCGYIGSQFWNQGRTQEIRDRVLHL